MNTLEICNKYILSITDIISNSEFQGGFWGGVFAFIAALLILIIKNFVSSHNLKENLYTSIAQELFENYVKTVKITQANKNKSDVDGLIMQTMHFHELKRNSNLIANSSLFSELSKIYIGFDLLNLGKGGDGGPARILLIEFFKTTLKIESFEYDNDTGEIKSGLDIKIIRDSLRKKRLLKGWNKKVEPMK